MTLTLYHFPIAICAQKVRVCLAEKGLAWESRMAQADLRSPSYLELNPGGYVPTLVHDGKVVTESRVICEYVNDAFPDPPLMPTDPYDRARVALWTKQIDDSLHLNVFTLSLAGGFLPHFQQMTDAQLEVRLPFDITKRVRARDILEHGVASKYVGVALRRFEKLVEDLERALSRSAWLVGDTYSLADVDYTPYLQRMSDLGLTFLWADKPNLQRWIAQTQARSSFEEVTRKWLSDEERVRTLANAERAEPEFRERLRAA